MASVKKRTIVMLVLVLQLAGAALATSPEDVPNPRSSGGWVTDLAGVLSASGRDRINQLSNELQAKNGTELAVVVLRQADRTPKAFATALFNRWGIGQRGLDNGVLVLVVMDQRRIEVEVGDGARRVMPDSKTASILNTHVVPLFKSGQPDQAIVTSVGKICEVLGPARYSARQRLFEGAQVADYSNVLTPEIKRNVSERLQKLYSEHGVEMVLQLRPKNKSAQGEFRHLGLGSNGVLALISTETGTVDVCAGAEVPFSDWSKASRLAGTKSWNECAPKLVGLVEDASAGLEVGPLSAQAAPTVPARPVAAHRPAPLRPAYNPAYALGGFGVLCLAGVYQFARHRPRKCPQCGARKLRLDEQSDDEHISSEDQLEERLGSVNYDAWLCPNCSHVHVERWNAWLTSYSNCPSCSRRTLAVSNTTVDYPTEYSSGRGRRDENCQNCSYDHTSYYTIPRKTKSSSSSGSSSSSSGFGGGRSSGGGSGASW